MAPPKLKMRSLLKPLFYTAIAPLIICLLVYDISRGGNDGAFKRRRKAALRERERRAPAPLPRGRPPVATRFDPALNRASPLLGRLPLELRQQIYDYALGGDVLHLVHLHKRLGHVRCVSGLSMAERWRRQDGDADGDGDGEDKGPRCICAAGVDDQQQYLLASRPLRPQQVASNLGLLRTCRQAYAEALPALYARNAFDVASLDVLIYLAQTVRPENLALITSLSVSWRFAEVLPGYVAASVLAPPFDTQTWLDFWAVVCERMGGLRELRCHLSASCFTTKSVKFAEPMRAVRALRETELRITTDFHGSHSRPLFTDQVEKLKETWRKPREPQEPGSGWGGGKDCGRPQSSLNTPS